MERYDVDNPDLAVNVVNDTQRKKFLDENIELYTRTLNNSVGKRERKYDKKKKKKAFLIEKARLYALILAILIATGIFAKVVTDVTIKAVEGVASSQVFSDYIDDKIDKYFKKMNNSGKKGERIENAYEYDIAHHESYVDYSPGVLKHYITENMDNEVETRCIVLAAYKVINADYRKEVFDGVFASISSDEEFKDKLPAYLDVKSFEEYIKGLGYDSVEEYNNKERKAIKKLHTDIMTEKEAKGEFDGRKRV